VRLIGVIDLLAGRAVHARRGQRDRYLPIGDGDAVALARTYLTRFGLRELYVADVDAILGTGTQQSIVAGVVALGAQVWLDTGATSADDARHAHALGVTHVVVGLETLPSYDMLDEICAALGGDCVAFSVDIRDGKPMGRVAGSQRPDQIAARAAKAGVSSVILLDLSRVGADSGVDVDMIGRIRDAVPDQLLLAGGGVRGLGDLEQLANAGCDGALVATALHAGRLGPAEIEAARHFSVKR
jgi:phosphoribosylformimino-5-aminoimidazole carboxamide ribotide isomerase